MTRRFVNDRAVAFVNTETQMHEQSLCVVTGPVWFCDRYWNLPGQSLALDGVADGTYALVVTLNPSRILFESARSSKEPTLAFAISSLPTNEKVGAKCEPACFSTAEKIPPPDQLLVAP